MLYIAAWNLLHMSTSSEFTLAHMSWKVDIQYKLKHIYSKANSIEQFPGKWNSIMLWVFKILKQQVFPQMPEINDM